MSSANPPATATSGPRPATPMSNGSANHPADPPPATNGHPNHAHETRPAPAPPANMAGKKGKPKKAPEPNEASKLIAARITQLEQDAAGEKDQEAEIGACLSLQPAGRLRGQWRMLWDRKGGDRRLRNTRQSLTEPPQSTFAACLQTTLQSRLGCRRVESRQRGFVKTGDLGFG